jgi:hypothetical protein
MKSQHTRFIFLCSEAFFHDSRPEPSSRSKLGDLFQDLGRFLMEAQLAELRFDVTIPKGDLDLESDYPVREALGEQCLVGMSQSA